MSKLHKLAMELLKAERAERALREIDDLIGPECRWSSTAGEEYIIPGERMKRIFELLQEGLSD